MNTVLEQPAVSQLAGEPLNDVVDRGFEFVVRGSSHCVKMEIFLLAGIYPIWNEHVQMHVEIQR
ncbi:MAG: hypothetical protein VYE04_10835 [Pseudomonadota bacterium]|nr:hypothetical protein [Pseudomonadota bacterium]